MTTEADLQTMIEVDRKLRLLEQLPGYVLELDNDGVVKSLNRVHPDMSKESFVGSPHWKHLPNASCREYVKVKFHRFLESETDQSFEVTGLPEGTWYRVWYRRIDPWMITMVAIDITEQKQYEQDLVQRNLELARSNEDLSQYAYVASHDLQEPLRTITSYLDIVQEELEGEVEGEVLEYMEFVVSAASKMRELIQGLLQYSRVDSEGEVEVVDIQTNLVALKRMWKHHPLDITVEDLPPILGNPTQVRQIFENLIANSIRYRKENTRAQVRIYHANTNEGHHEIVVSDQGKGIDPQYHHMIFQLFKRLHRSKDGTGIGLALVKKIMDRLGGEVWVESEEGQGADFHLTFPSP